MKTKWKTLTAMESCSGMCYEWHDIKGVTGDYANCKYFEMKNNKMKCLAHPNKKIKRIVAGEVFYSNKI